MSASNNGAVAVWLLFLGALVFAMVLLGGATRLTESGLSMVEWAPIMGVLPPLDESEWSRAFEQYQAYPEYRILNQDITLDGFKRIFYMEYAHRMLGRAIGVVFLVPFLFFLFTRRLRARRAIQLSVLFVLGGLQGLMGWYMVQSGLADVPYVSAYRLTAHLMLALLILGFILWIAFDLLDERPPTPYPPAGLRLAAAVVLAATILMIFTGGFVAGTNAGFVFNTFPTMHGRWIPEGLWAMQPGWRNLFENVTTVQFVHRCMALTLTVVIVGFWIALMRSGLEKVRFIGNLLLLLLAVQVGLGITTLVHAVPTALAVAHQGGALLLFALALLINHRIRRVAAVG